MKTIEDSKFSRREKEVKTSVSLRADRELMVEQETNGETIFFCTYTDPPCGFYIGLIKFLGDQKLPIPKILEVPERGSEKWTLSQIKTNIKIVKERAFPIYYLDDADQTGKSKAINIHYSQNEKPELWVEARNGTLKLNVATVKFLVKKIPELYGERVSVFSVIQKEFYSQI